MWCRRKSICGELKEILYDRPYINEVKQVPYEGFDSVEVQHVEEVIHIPCREDIWALFQMTPYFWNTPGRHPAPGGADAAGLPYQLRHSYFPQKRKELGETGCIYEKIYATLYSLRCLRSAANPLYPDNFRREVQ